jgi:hypothetical protein
MGNIKQDIQEQIAKWEKRNALLAQVRTAVESVKHYRKFDGRVIGKVRECIDESYVVCAASFGPSISIHGNGIPFGERIVLALYSNDRMLAESWYDKLMTSIAVAESYDVIQRLKAEQDLLPELEAIESQIAELRQKAQDMIAQLPVPSAATLRDKAHFWSTASAAVSKHLPLSLGDIKA